MSRNHAAPTQKEFEAKVAGRRAARFAHIDAMTPEMRELVHHFSYVVVKTCLDLGVRKPAQIKHLVNTILDEFSPTRGSYAQQGIRTEIERPEA